MRQILRPAGVLTVIFPVEARWRRIKRQPAFWGIPSRPLATGSWASTANWPSYPAQCAVQRSSNARSSTAIAARAAASAASAAAIAAICAACKASCASSLASAGVQQPERHTIVFIIRFPFVRYAWPWPPANCDRRHRRARGPCLLVWANPLLLSATLWTPMSEITGDDRLKLARRALVRRVARRRRGVGGDYFRFEFKPTGFASSASRHRMAPLAGGSRAPASRPNAGELKTLEAAMHEAWVCFAEVLRATGAGDPSNADRRAGSGGRRRPGGRYGLSAVSRPHEPLRQRRGE